MPTIIMNNIRLKIFKQSIYKNPDHFEEDINNFLVSNKVDDFKIGIHQQYIVCIISYYKGNGKD